jgi:ABC-2 type transport system permease protein
MKKIFLIGIKDVRLALRDRTALLMMLLAPFILTLGLGFVTGRFSGNSSSGISNIPVIIVNQDVGQVGSALVDLLHSPDLQELVLVRDMSDEVAARQLVDTGQNAGVIIIPPGFTDSIISSPTTSAKTEIPQIELYTDPTRPTSVGVIKTILDQFLGQVETGRIAAEVTITQLITNGLVQVQDAVAIGQEIGVQQAAAAGQTNAITIKDVTSNGKTIQFDVLGYMAPGMALMFLMFTASYGGRVLLAERNQGTLPRLLVSPTTSAQVLAGKIFGTFLTGAAQVFILILASTLFFSLHWGDPLGVLVLVLAAVFAAVGWGMLITAVAKTPGQVNWIGTAIMLLFGLLGGSFLNLEGMPDWFNLVSKITPNAWGLDGFTTLAMGGNLSNVMSPVLGLLAMGIILFIVSLLLFNRKGITQR